jgi:hypothetical protein
MERSSSSIRSACMQWLHNGTPPDFQLQLVRDPAL